MKTLLFASLLFSFTALQSASPVLWRDPGAIETRDLLWGNAPESRAPQGPFQFVEEKHTGTTAKVIVTDANGVSWDVKLAPEEAHPEVAAGRLLWALGYLGHEMYYVPSGRIEGAKDLKRAKDALKSDGSFTYARFRRRDPAIVDGPAWGLASNPFVGTQELSGLIIMMAMINNWDTDAPSGNQEVLTVTKSDGTTEQWYVAKDLGASFGRFKGPNGTPIKWAVAEYEKDNLVAGVEGDTLVLNYEAFGKPPTRVPLEHARWFAGLVGRLTDEQVRSAFKAAGAKPDEIERYTRKFMSKVAELRAAAGATVQQ